MMSVLSHNVHCFWFCSTKQNQRLLKESMKSDAKILENTRTCDVGTSTVLDVPLSDVPLSFRARVQAFSKKCDFFGFAVYFDWAGGSGQMMSVLSRGVHCF